MKKWKYSIDISDAWNKSKKGIITTKELIPIIIKKIKTWIKNYEDDYDLSEILEDMDLLTYSKYGSEEELEDEFDYIWSRFYDWADYNRCWIKTI